MIFNRVSCAFIQKQDGLLRAAALVQAETEKCAEMEEKLNAELDQSQMRKVIVDMVSNRLGALEATTAELVRVQSASLESLRVLHLKVATPASSALKMSKEDKTKRLSDLVDSFD